MVLKDPIWPVDQFYVIVFLFVCCFTEKIKNKQSKNRQSSAKISLGFGLGEQILVVPLNLYKQIVVVALVSIS